MDTSCFTDLSNMPDNNDLKVALAEMYQHWMEIRKFVFEKYPAAIEEWHVAVKKFGWNYRIKDRKRAIVYLSPQNGYFTATFVFGQKATDQIIAGQISEEIKKELLNSKVYMEGRVLRIDLHDSFKVDDIRKLIEIKITC